MGSNEKLFKEELNKKMPPLNKELFKTTKKVKFTDILEIAEKRFLDKEVI